MPDFWGKNLAISVEKGWFSLPVLLLERCCVISNAKKAVSGGKKKSGKDFCRNFANRRKRDDGYRASFPAEKEDCFVEFIMVLCVLGKGRTLFLSGITEENGVTSLSCQTR